MDALKKINWKQPKYMIPLIIYFPLLFVGTNVAFLAFSIPLGKLADRVGTKRIWAISAHCWIGI